MSRRLANSGVKGAEGGDRHPQDFLHAAANNRDLFPSRATGLTDVLEWIHLLSSEKSLGCCLVLVKERKSNLRLVRRS